MSLHTGQRVTPIAPEPGRQGWINLATAQPRPGPAMGRVLIIQYMYTDADGSWLNFAEFPNADYDAAEFRPVAERRTDISALRALLNPANHDHKHLETTT